MKMKHSKLKLSVRAALFMVGLLVSLSTFAQEILIKGHVKDNTGEPVIGANIVIKGTVTGTITDFDGNFALQAPADATLSVSYIGYKAQDVEVNNQTNLMIVLVDDSELLDEVIVIGYGRVKKSDATGSVLAIKPDDMNKGNQVTAQQALQGKAAGVLVTNKGGQPGEGATIRIRGGSSLSASNDPLIIIDGVAMDNTSTAGASNVLSSLNPNDIESFTILKDASSTAIYGSRASNGVIIITTKKGTMGSRRPSVNYSNNFSLSYNPKKYDVLTGNEYREFIKKQYAGDEATINGLGTANTDWQDEIFRVAFSTDHNVSVTGATDFTPYRVSVSYTNQQGIIKENGYQRLTGGLALTPQFMDKHLSLNINLKGSHEKNNFIENPIGGALSFDPTRPVYSNDSEKGMGYFIWNNSAGDPIGVAGANPVSMLKERDDTSNVNRFFGNVQADYKVHGFEDLRLNVNYGFDVLKSDGHVFIDTDAPRSYTGYGGQGLDRNYVQKKRTTQLEMYANYAKEVGVHNFDVMGGYSWQHFWNSYENKETSVDGKSIYADLYRNPEYYLISFFGRVNYSLNNKYLFTATIRDDGSSRFAKKHRWGLFPSAALAWKISEESFLAGSDILSELKLRLSYGKTGQQDITRDANSAKVSGYYDYIPTYSFSEETAMYQFGNKYYTTIRPDGYDPELKWETTTTYNIGLDYGFLNGRIYGTLDGYIRKTDDLLNRITFPAGSNLTDQVMTNIGSMENKGIEFAVTAVPIQKKNLSWDVNFNVTYNKSKITKLSLNDSPDYFVPVGDISGGIGAKAQVHTIGYAPFTFFLKKQLYDENGKPLEQFSKDDPAMYEPGGVEDDKFYGKKPAPDVFLGLSSKVNYKQWTFGFNSHANIGNYVFNNVRSTQYREKAYQGSVEYSNILKFTRDHGFEKSAQYWSDYFLQNASFFKMDNISVGYSIPKLGKSDISLRITASCENVFTITGYDGLDPEVENGIDKNLYSRPRTFMIGFNFNL